jgi:hypothetical protein
MEEKNVDPFLQNLGYTSFNSLSVVLTLNQPDAERLLNLAKNKLFEKKIKNDNEKIGQFLGQEVNFYYN